ncbi:MAG: hypothetical protein KDC98_24220 [Planctomycetes bacterium]|nr:hypothetical protein [Planctomycetota bacterium]
MTRPRRSALAPLTTLLAIAAPSQTLTLPGAVSGQPLTLSTTGGTPSVWMLWLGSVQGLGPGPCSPAHGLCLDLLHPVALALSAADGAGAASFSLSMPSWPTPIVLGFQGVEFAAAMPLPKTNAVATTLQPLSAWNDEFAGTALGPQWSVLNAGLATIQVQNGTLDIAPTVAQLPNMWYQHGEGPLVWRLVSGDFFVTARLTVDDPAAPGAPPAPTYRLAGIIARNPASTPADQDYVHVALGSGSNSQPTAVEDKSTTDSVSDWIAYPVTSNTGEIAIERIGRWFSLHYRLDGNHPWQLLRTHDRPDLPHALQIGLMSYSASSPAALRGRFDYLRFQ